jgi:hypothetical protein
MIRSSYASNFAATQGVTGYVSIVTDQRNLKDRNATKRGTGTGIRCPGVTLRLVFSWLSLVSLPARCRLGMSEIF